MVAELNVCQKEFSNKFNLKKYQERMHGKEDEETHTASEDSEYKISDEKKYD